MKKLLKLNNKCFEYSVHQVDQSNDEERVNPLIDTAKFIEEDKEDENEKTKKKVNLSRNNIQTISGNINPLITESLTETPKRRVFKSKSGIPLDPLANDLPV